MIILQNNNVILSSEEFKKYNIKINSSEILDFVNNDKTKIKISDNKKQFKIFKIDFNGTYNFQVKTLKKLYSLISNGYIFGIPFNEYNLVGIVDNCESYDNNVNSDNEILFALSAIFIADLRERYNFLFEKICDYLDSLWGKYNPCKFKNDTCIAARNGMTTYEKDGCCHPFYYSKDILKFVEGVHKCKYLDPVKHCTMRNITDKLFVCDFLKDEKLFDIDFNKIFLIQIFFNSHQKIAIQHNFFITKDKFVDKLIEELNDKEPLSLYCLNDHFRAITYTPESEKEQVKYYETHKCEGCTNLTYYKLFNKKLLRKLNITKLVD